MKKFAYYLPQFHQIPENDRWWGKGFTEWVNVKKAVALYKGHQQPKIPLEHNYYELNEKTLREQANLANNYKIDGMIFYHYYFCGKKLLQKPAEILLNQKDIQMNFFFCWANHSWIRSWEGSKEILVEQTYGTKEDWIHHFNYLLPFFQDKRYEKKDNKPIFVIFNSNFKEKEEMFRVWNSLALNNGFDGIYFIERLEHYQDVKTLENKNSNKCYYYREPNAAIDSFSHRGCYFLSRCKHKAIRMLSNKGIKCIEVYSGDKLFNEMIRNYRQDVIPGLFFEWDNTPRHGYRGYVINPPCKELFIKYMDTIKDSEYVFINAWNEWCEGMILEPTEENKCKYLEWIREWSIENDCRVDRI
ncbi:MAG: glycoside hydrolase family 99-like domain-containing protein [Lactobacillus sp.]|nr:glycoside hydrolase family 99-like domain-containing protein [Lactobacillus sp.]